jgi:hypothetical protein
LDRICVGRDSVSGQTSTAGSNSSSQVTPKLDRIWVWGEAQVAGHSSRQQAAEVGGMRENKHRRSQ